MSKNVLSQSEIDSLISSLSDDEGGEPSPGVESEQPAKGGIPSAAPEEYSAYDFRSPTKLTKEQMNTLRVIHDNFARIVGNFFSAYLRVPFKLEVISVTQVTYEEFISSITIPTVISVFDMSPEMGVAVMEVNPASAFSLIDLNFGGDGKSIPKNRELTDIELEVMRHISNRLLENLTYVWKVVANLDPEIQSLDTNPHFTQAIAANETIALITFNVEVQENKGMINFCYPYITLEKISSNLTAQSWYNEYRKIATQPDPRHLESSLAEAEVDVRAVLGETKITMEDFFQLQEGDVLQLNRNEGDPLDLLVEDNIIFKGHPGVIEGSNLALQITGLAEEEEKEEEEEESEADEAEESEEQTATGEARGRSRDADRGDRQKKESKAESGRSGASRRTQNEARESANGEVAGETTTEKGPAANGGTETVESEESNAGSEEQISGEQPASEGNSQGAAGQGQANQAGEKQQNSRSGEGQDSKQAQDLSQRKEKVKRQKQREAKERQARQGQEEAE